MKGNDAIELALHWHNYRAKTATVSAKNRERSHTLKLFLEEKSALFTHLAGPQDKLRRCNWKQVLLKPPKTSQNFSNFSRILSEQFTSFSCCPQPEVHSFFLLPWSGQTRSKGTLFLLFLSQRENCFSHCTKTKWDQSFHLSANHQSGTLSRKWLGSNITTNLCKALC